MTAFVLVSLKTDFNDKIVLGKHKIFTEALAKINFENHKELAMNEVHVTTAKVVLISLISGAAVALITHLFFEIWIKKLSAFGRFLFFTSPLGCFLAMTSTQHWIQNNGVSTEFGSYRAVSTFVYF